MGAADRTKQALARALKELMETSSLEKISVGDITRQAGMGRNTFYYHFKDKYDLVNWIFESESLPLINQPVNAENWGDFLSGIDSYICQNLGFYRNALAYNGQNSLQDYIYDVLVARLTQRVSQLNQQEGLHMRQDEMEFTANFFASALHGLLMRNVRQGLPHAASRYQGCVRRICTGGMIEEYLRISGTPR